MSVTGISNSDAFPAVKQQCRIRLISHKQPEGSAVPWEHVWFQQLSIENVERVLDRATARQIETKADIRNVILVLEEAATKLRRTTSMTNPPTAASIAFSAQLAEIEQLLRIAHDKAAGL